MNGNAGKCELCDGTGWLPTFHWVQTGTGELVREEAPIPCPRETCNK